MSEAATGAVLTAMITRPAGQAESLLSAIRAAGYTALEFPLLEIRPVSDTSDLHAALSALERYALVVFVSPNAIDQALAYRDAIGVNWPLQVPIGVVGPGSVRALAQWGIAAPRYKVVAPAGAQQAVTSASAPDASLAPTDTGEVAADLLRFDSEALLEAIDHALGLDNLSGREVLLVRGDGGRELLADTLRAMGANLTCVSAYQRSAPHISAAQWQALSEQLEGGPQQLVWLFTSSEGVRHLDELAHASLSQAHYAALKRCAVIAPHTRIAETARKLGFGTITLSGAGDHNIVSALLSLATLQATQLVPRRMTETHDSSLDPSSTESTAQPSESTGATAAAAPASASVPPAGAYDLRTSPAAPPVGRVLPWVLVVLVLAAAGVGAYALNRKLDRFEQAEAVRQQASDAQLAQSQALVHQLDSQLTTQLGLLNSKLQDNATAQEALQEQFQDLARNRDDWTLAEIGQMLSTASEQLQLTGNLQLALFALQSADTRLATSTGPQMLSVRRAIEQDIEKIKSAPQVDLAGMAIKLDDAIAQVDTLPLAGEAQQQPAPQSDAQVQAQAKLDVASTQPAWRTWLSELLSQAGTDLKSLVQVRRIEDPDAMLVAPDQGYYLRANLKLRLLSARLSLLARNQVTLKSDLSAASGALGHYFDPSSKRVQTVRALLQQVDQSSANVELPNMNASLTAVRQFKSRS